LTQRTNRQFERANGIVLQGLKSRVFDQLKKFIDLWVGELPAVLWGLRTTPDPSTGFTPFFLTYGPLTPTEPRKLSRMRST
jgi:hypothetical protein